MTNQEIYDQGYALSSSIVDDMRLFSYRDEQYSIPMHHVIVEMLDGHEVVDINRVREIDHLYKTERI